MVSVAARAFAGIVLLTSAAGAEPVEEERFLSELFALTGEAAVLNAEVVLWFRSGGKEGLYPADFATQGEPLHARLEALTPPARIATVHEYVRGSLQLQHAFVAEWFDAREQGRPFESQLTDEFAYHEGLHRSHRLLLKAYAELRALYPKASAEELRSFQHHLRAMDLR